MTEYVTVEGTEGETDVSLGEAELDPSLLELFREGLEVVGGRGVVVRDAVVVVRVLGVRVVGVRGDGVPHAVPAHALPRAQHPVHEIRVLHLGEVRCGPVGHGVDGGSGVPRRCVRRVQALRARAAVVPHALHVRLLRLDVLVMPQPRGEVPHVHTRCGPVRRFSVVQPEPLLVVSEGRVPVVLLSHTRHILHTVQIPVQLVVVVALAGDGHLHRVQLSLSSRHTCPSACAQVWIHCRSGHFLCCFSPGCQRGETLNGPGGGERYAAGDAMLRVAVSLLPESAAAALPQSVVQSSSAFTMRGSNHKSKTPTCIHKKPGIGARYIRNCVVRFCRFSRDVVVTSLSSDLQNSLPLHSEPFQTEL